MVGILALGDSPTRPAIAGLILAGGLSTRMGRDKAFVEFRGQPMIAHVVARLGQQVERVAVSANGDPSRFDVFGLPVLPDLDPGQPGPLAGIAAGLSWARSNECEGVVTAPCDAPFAPRDLVERLTGDGDGRPAVAESARGVEPLFAFWPTGALTAVEAALATGDTAVWKLLERLGARRVAFPLVDGEDWTLNLNSPADLAAAERGP
jgi:molybdopterin-guanine dinucleotide biosynthesis protein A